MRIVCQDVVKAAEKLGIVTDELKHEEAALAVQQHKVATISESMEQRETRYKDAGEHDRLICSARVKILIRPSSRSVFAVLEETKQIVQLCDKKRDNHDD